MKRDDWDASSIFSNKQKILAWGCYHLLDSASPQILLHLQILKHLIILVFPFLFFFVCLDGLFLLLFLLLGFFFFFSLFLAVGVAFKLCMPAVHTRAHTCCHPSHACGSQRTTCGNQFSSSLTFYKWCHVPWPTKLAHCFLVWCFRLFGKKIDLTSNIITADVFRRQLHNETFIKLCVGGKLQLIHKNDHFKVFADRNKETKYKTFSATLSK